MTTYNEVAVALVDAGYVSEADIEAVVAVLTDALIVEAAEEAQDEVAEDYADEEDLIAEAQVWQAEDAAMGRADDVAMDEEIIADAIDQELDDMATMAAAEDVIDAACADAAAALLAAELIDEANLDASAVVIHTYWHS